MAAIDPEAGFVKLPRAIFSEPWAHRPYCLALFVYLLAHANQEPKEWNGIRIERGQLVTSLRSLAKNVGETPAQVRTALKELETAGFAHLFTHRSAQSKKAECAHPRAQGYTIVTISNYDCYNGLYSSLRTPPRTPQPAADAHPRAHKSAYTKEDIYIFLFEIEPDSVFRAILKDWIDYKVERGELYKGKKSLLATRNKLRRESGDNPEAARAMIEKAMANGWQGFFPLDSVGARSPGRPSSSTRQDCRFIDPTDTFKANY